MKERIEAWLREEGKFKAYQEHKGCRWVMVANPSKAQPATVRIINPVSFPSQILIIIGQKISEEIQKFIQKMDDVRKEELLLNLRLEMNRRPIEFKMNHPEGILQEVQIQYVIYEDGLTKNAFFKGLREVYKSFLQLRWLLQKQLGKASKKDQEAFGTKVIPFQSDFS